MISFRCEVVIARGRFLGLEVFQGCLNRLDADVVVCDFSALERVFRRPEPCNPTAYFGNTLHKVSFVRSGVRLHSLILTASSRSFPHQE